MHCLVSKNIWRRILICLGMDEVSFANGIDAFNFNSIVFQKFFSLSKAAMIWLTICWNIWIGRNNILFYNFVVNVDGIVVSAKFLSLNWLIIGNKDRFPCNFMNWFMSPLNFLNQSDLS